jgi:hypothetical protein
MTREHVTRGSRVSGRLLRALLTVPIGVLDLAGR